MPDTKIVQLAIKVAGDTGELAVSNFIDILVEKGLREWLYRVEDPETGELLGLYNGYGDAADIPSVVEQEGAPVLSTDDELLRLAEELNETDEAQATVDAAAKVVGDEPSQ
jgi:hypothetical protein